MSFNKNFNDNFHANTFQNTQYMPPPPPPPAFFIPPQNYDDDEFIKQFNVSSPRKPKVQTMTSISTVRKDVYNLVKQLNELKCKESFLTDNIDNLTHEQWSNNMQQIAETKNAINSVLEKINGFNFEVLHKLLAKRSAKRARLRRQRSERKQAKEEWLKKMQEKSRKIDEKLQKTQDDIKKAKQEEEAKIQADLVLKETLRKKHDAKKYIVKLDALVNLRRARHNTARGRGRGADGADAEADMFNANIEKLKSLWKQRLSMYTLEERGLVARLRGGARPEQPHAAAGALRRWRQALFGGGDPQHGYASVHQFVAVRCEWDKFLNIDGTPLPVGWVSPAAK